MPSYPTRKPRTGAPARGAQTRPQQWPRRDNRTPWSPPKPANDNPRPLPKPANDNYKRLPKPKRAPLPLRGVFRRSPLGQALEWGEWGYRRWYPPAFDIPEMPPGWFIRHGPNTYAPPYARDWEMFGTGYNRSGPTGPETAKLTRQSVGNLHATLAEYFIARPNPVNMGLWIYNNSRTRSASAMAFTRDSEGFLPSADRLRPQPIFMPDPFAIPYPENVPLPLPQQYPLPLTPGTIQPGRISRPEPLPTFRPSQFPGRAPFQSPVRNPFRRPSQSSAFELSTQAGPGGRPASAANPNGTHSSRPPGRGEKEKKGRASRAMWAALGAFGKFTEGLDLIDAAWKALPKSARSKSFHNGKYVRPAWWKRAADVYNNADKIDLEAFAKNVVANSIEDAFLGMQGGFVGKVGGRPQPGINQARREFSDMDPTQQMPFDADQVVDYLYRRLKRQVVK